MFEWINAEAWIALGTLVAAGNSSWASTTSSSFPFYGSVVCRQRKRDLARKLGMALRCWTRLGLLFSLAWIHRPGRALVLLFLIKLSRA